MAIMVMAMITSIEESRMPKLRNIVFHLGLVAYFCSWTNHLHGQDHEMEILLQEQRGFEVPGAPAIGTVKVSAESLPIQLKTKSSAGFR